MTDTGVTKMISTTEKLKREGVTIYDGHVGVKKIDNNYYTYHVIFNFGHTFIIFLINSFKLSNSEV